MMMHTITIEYAETLKRREEERAMENEMAALMKMVAINEATDATFKALAAEKSDTPEHLVEIMKKAVEKCLKESKKEEGKLKKKGRQLKEQGRQKKPQGYSSKTKKIKDQRRWWQKNCRTRLFQES